MTEPNHRYIGVDLGAETIKVVELTRIDGTLTWTRREILEHHKEPGLLVTKLLQQWNWDGVEGASVTGRLSRQIHLPKVPVKQAQVAGYRFGVGEHPGTVVSIGSHGFSVLELRANGVEVFRENSRCSQGTGNFLRQLIERFSLTIEQAGELCATVDRSAPLSGRCPVILKTDMTHLANKGEDRARILAGLFDAVCENVMVLLKPGRSPSPVSLIGGVSRSPRVQKVFGETLARNGMSLQLLDNELYLYLEALGAAVTASHQPEPVPPLEKLLQTHKIQSRESLPPLASFLSKVHRMPPQVLSPAVPGQTRFVLGFDIGSTGSKAVALDMENKTVAWESYLKTEGNPVLAAQTLLRRFTESPAGKCDLLAVAVTGSGREIAGSLLSACYGPSSVFILNEIAAHARGATLFDKQVDTIFEIGGQDAKYIRLSDGRVVDCAMNEACSAGTGSFIEEQGSKFAGIRDIAHLGQEALAADKGISLGQHCSVFMAEVIDGAVAAGVEPRTIIAGLYDSIIQNYLNRVKGNRTVGKVIFCQGMPFSSDALAAAVVRQTGSRVVIPPNPGTVGALGIGLLALDDLDVSSLQPLNPERFLRARIEQKDTFICGSTSGCGAPGNRCRIDRLSTTVEEKTMRFTWGGGCALYDKGTRKKKLPDLSPDPFREREALVQQLLSRFETHPGRASIAITDEFTLKSLMPFYSTFLYELGFNLSIAPIGGQTALKRGIQQANVPFCAPMQLYHGLVGQMADSHSDYLFLPMLRTMQRLDREQHSNICPIVQGSPDILRLDLGAKARGKLISPVINMGVEGLESAEFHQSCLETASLLGRSKDECMSAYKKALEIQTQFEIQCLEIGHRALAFCQKNKVNAVVVAGRPYTIYNTVLNSNVPAILREQGAIGIPIDCYPVDPGQPVHEDIYWGHSQRILRAAREVRKTPGVYSLYCSNYSCGPDSFTLHFYSYIMEGKPFAIIETDGHSGDAGTKTRVEAFLHCVVQDQGQQSQRTKINDFSAVALPMDPFEEMRQHQDVVIVPSMGIGSEIVAASMRSLGLKAECLSIPDAEALRLGRRYTSGKECLPMCLTLGNLLKRVQMDTTGKQRFVLLMPKTNGPCRFGAYNLLNIITFERLGIKERMRIWSPVDCDYFKDTPPGWAILTFAGIIAADMILQGLFDCRPVETRPGAAQAVFQRNFDRLLKLLEKQTAVVNSMPASLWQTLNQDYFGVTKLLEETALEYAAIKGAAKIPSVMLVGEIYVRTDPFANDFVIEKLEARGLRVVLAPLSEWMEYSDYASHAHGEQPGFSSAFRRIVKARMQDFYYNLCARILGWTPRLNVTQAIDAARPYIREALRGEALLTLGGPLHEWSHGYIDGVVSAGPLECMPNKIAESQYYHATERVGLPNLTLSLNGEPIDSEILDNFVFEVYARYRKKHDSQDSGVALSVER